MVLIITQLISNIEKKFIYKVYKEFNDFQSSSKNFKF